MTPVMPTLASAIQENLNALVMTSLERGLPEFEHVGLGFLHSFLSNKDNSSSFKLSD